MRRRVLVVAMGIVILVSFARIGLALTQTAADDFSSGGYSGSTGTVAWASTWAEIGEGDGAGSGAVQVRDDSPSLCSAGSCLTLDTVVGVGVGAQRSVDTAAATDTTLAYHIEFPGGFLISGQMRVESSADGGPWQLLRTHDVGAKGDFNANLPEADVVAIRFLLSGLSLATSAGVDNVVVTIVAPDPTTTTTTSTTAPPTGPTTTQPSPTTTPGPTATTRSVDRPTDETPGQTTTSQPNDSTTSTVTDEDGEGGLVPAAIDDEALPPSQTFGVVTNVNPGLGPTSNALLKPRTGFLVDFSSEVEDVTIDLLASALLGLLLAVVSDRRLGAKIEG
jgi:hypothetical protein